MSMNRLAAAARRWSHYGTLGVPKTASVKEIKSSFREKSLKCHPDKFPGDALKEAEFKRLNEAYQVLVDSEQRKKYDAPPAYRSQSMRSSTRRKSKRNDGSYHQHSKNRHRNSQDSGVVIFLCVVMLLDIFATSEKSNEKRDSETLAALQKVNDKRKHANARLRKVTDEAAETGVALGPASTNQRTKRMIRFDSSFVQDMTVFRGTPRKNFFVHFAEKRHSEEKKRLRKVIDRYWIGQKLNKKKF